MSKRVSFLDDAAPDHTFREAQTGEAQTKLSAIGRASVSRARRDRMGTKGEAKRVETPRATLVTSGEVRADAGAASDHER